MLEDNLEKSKKSLGRIVQTEEGVQTIKTKIDLLQTTVEALPGTANVNDSPPKAEREKMMKLLNDNETMVRHIFEKVQLLEADRGKVECAKDFEEGEIVSQKKDEKAKEVTTGLSKLMNYEDMDLAEYLETPLGMKLKELLVTMENPDVDDRKALVEWWDYQKRRWTKNGRELKALPAWYRLASWWSGQFLWTWTALTTEFMLNPFQLSLQEIIYKAALLRNLLNALGLVMNSDAKVKWAEPFVNLGNSEPRLSDKHSNITVLVKKLTDESDLEVLKVREALMKATQRCSNHIWTVNRELNQWEQLDSKKIFAMSSSCDKVEYHPPIKRVSSSVPMSLMHLAETNQQISDETNRRQVKTFEKFVKSITRNRISFDEFRNSETYENFLNSELMPSASGIQARSTPTVDEYDDYTEEELGVPLKRNRYH